MLGTVTRAGELLDLFSDQPEWGVTAVASELQIAKSQAHELLTSLCFIGLLRRSGRGRYRLGWRTVSLGAELLSQEFRGDANVAVRRLALRSGESTQLAALDRTSIVTLARCRGKLDEAGTPPLRRDTLHCTAAGKLLLSAMAPEAADAILDANGMTAFTDLTITSKEGLHHELRRIREDGLAYDQGELTVDRRAIAVLVQNPSGSVSAALSIVGHVSRWDRHVYDYVALLRGEARRMRQALRADPSAASLAVAPSLRSLQPQIA